MTKRNPKEGTPIPRRRAKRAVSGIDRNVYFSTIIPALIGIFGTLAGLLGGALVAYVQVAHDDDARHRDQLVSACGTTVQLMEHELSDLSAVWAKASLKSPDSVEALKNLESNHIHLEDSASEFYLVASDSAIENLKNFSEYDLQARIYLYRAFAAGSPDRENHLQQVERDITLAGRSKQELIGGCREEINS
jgi:hypothetical protein